MKIKIQEEGIEEIKCNINLNFIQKRNCIDSNCSNCSYLDRCINKSYILALYYSTLVKTSLYIELYLIKSSFYYLTHLEKNSCIRKRIRFLH